MFRVALFVAIVALIACVNAQQTYTVSLTGIEFTNVPGTVNVGDTVEFVWVDGLHSVVESADGQDECTEANDASGNGFAAVPTTGNTANTNTTASVTFTVAGPFHFFCRQHCAAGMADTIDVVDPSATTTTTGSSTTTTSTTGTPANNCGAPPDNQCRRVRTTNVGEGQTCDLGCYDSQNNEITRRVCNADNLACDFNGISREGTCRRTARIGESCNGNVICRDGNYDVECLDNNICGNNDVLAPGEACQTTRQANFDGDGCARGDCITTYSATKCPSGACCEFSDDTEPCNDNDECRPTSFCNSNDQCEAKHAIGEACSDDDMCVGTAFCIGSVCTEYFSRTEGQSCDNDFSCEAGLCCDGGSCRRPTGTNGAACSDDSDCGVCGDCECDGDSGERRCVVETIRRSQADAFQNALECLVANDCEASDPLADGDVEFFPGGCADQSCRGEVNNAYTAAGGQSASSASALIASLFLIAIAALLLF